MAYTELKAGFIARLAIQDPVGFGIQMSAVAGLYSFHLRVAAGEISREPVIKSRTVSRCRAVRLRHSV